MHFVEAKSLLTKWGGMNIYRGCAHGCVYCDSRSDCYQFTHPFEDIEVKENAPELLEKILKSKRKKCMIGSGSMCDPYQPCEKELQLTRKCLKLLDQYEFGAAVITKSDLVLRDMDLFCSIHELASQHGSAFHYAVYLSFFQYIYGFLSAVDGNDDDIFSGNKTGIMDSFAEICRI